MMSRFVLFLFAVAAVARPAAAQSLDVSRIYFTGGSVVDASTATPTVSSGFTFSGTVTATTFAGSCASCTSIPAGNLTGTVPAATLAGRSLADLGTRSATDLSSGNLAYARLPSGSGTWSASPTISGTLTMAGTILPDAASTRDIGSATLPFRQANLSQINATLFAKQTQTLYGGWLAVSKNAGTFAAAVSSGATTIDFGQAMTANQFVLVRSLDTGGSVAEEYIKVVSLSSGTTYNVTRNLSGTGAKNWPVGAPYQVRGVTGDGWLELNAFDTPRLSVFTQGSAYNNSTENIRIGHLAGMPNSSTGIGIYIGDASNYLRYDSSALKLQSSSGVSIDGSGISVTPDSAIFSAAKAYKFPRTTAASTLPVNCASNNSGDEFGLGAWTSNLSSTGVEFSEVDIHNKMAGGAIGGCAGRAFVDIAATGWNGGSAMTASAVRIGSDPSNLFATGVRISSGTAVVDVGRDSTTSGVYITGSPITLTGPVTPVAWQTTSITLANGRNDNVAFNGASFIRSIAGPTAAFAISGLAAGADGQILTILHNQSQVLTLNHADANSSAANRIYCPGSVNVSTSTTFGTVVLQYDGAIPGWIVLSIK